MPLVVKKPFTDLNDDVQTKPRSRSDKINPEHEEKPVAVSSMQTENSHGGSELTFSMPTDVDFPEGDAEAQRSGENSDAAKGSDEQGQAQDDAPQQQPQERAADQAGVEGEGEEVEDGEEENQDDAEEGDSIDSSSGDADVGEEAGGDEGGEEGEDGSEDVEAEGEGEEDEAGGEAEKEDEGVEDEEEEVDGDEYGEAAEGDDGEEGSEGEEDEIDSASGDEAEEDLEEEMEDDEESDEQHNTYQYNTQQVVDMLADDDGGKKYYQTEFYRFIEMFAEEKLKLYDYAASDEYNVKKLMFRQYERRPLNHYRMARIKDSVVLVLDNSGSMEWWAGNLLTLAKLALARRDVEVYIAPNGYFKEKITPDRRTVSVNHETMMKTLRGRKIIYVGDFDGVNTAVELSHHNDVVWICPESRYRHFRAHGWASYGEEDFRGAFIRVYDLDEMFWALKKLLSYQHFSRVWLDLHEDDAFEDDTW